MSTEESEARLITLFNEITEFVFHPKKIRKMRCDQKRAPGTSSHLDVRAVPEINLCVCVCVGGGGGGGVDGKKIFRWVEVLFITDFRRLGGQRNYVFRWVMGLFSVLFIQNKNLLENGQTVPFPVWIFIPATYTYVVFASAPHPRSQLPGSLTE